MQGSPVKGGLRKAGRVPAQSEGGGQGSEQRPASPKPARPGTCLGCTAQALTCCAHHPRRSPSGRWAVPSPHSSGSLAAGAQPGQVAWEAGLLRPVLSAPSLREACSYLDCVTSETSQSRGEGTPRGGTVQRLGCPRLPGGGPRVPQSREHAWYLPQGRAAQGSWVMAPQVTGRQALPGPE